MRKCWRSQIGAPQRTLVIIVSCRWRQFRMNIYFQNMVVAEPSPTYICTTHFYDFANLCDDPLVKEVTTKTEFRGTQKNKGIAHHQILKIEITKLRESKKYGKP